MRIYKDKQFLVFDYEDGRTCKYDFATKTAIGIKGKPVKDLRGQLTGFSMNTLLDSFEDKNYANFLKYIRSYLDYGGYITNIGTILTHVPEYRKYEQIFSAGIQKIEGRLSYTINDIPKSLIKCAKEHDIVLSDRLIDYWKVNPDAYNLAYQLEYISLDDKDLSCILKDYKWSRKDCVCRSIFNILIDEYNYNAKSLLMYLDYLKTFEAINFSNFMQELYDYAMQMNEISPKYDKYPRHFLTTHQIASRNYRRLKAQFDEQKFKSRINKDYEFTYKDYCFIYPDCTQDIKNEAVQQNNCVASYVDRVINGDCHIMFLRKKDSTDKSLVTIEIRDNKIVQARRRFNDPVTEADQKAIDAWDKKFANYNKDNKEIKEEEIAA